MAKFRFKGGKFVRVDEEPPKVAPVYDSAKWTGLGPWPKPGDERCKNT